MYRMGMGGCIDESRKRSVGGRVCGDGTRIIGLDMVIRKIVHSSFGTAVDNTKDIAKNVNGQLHHFVSHALTISPVPNTSMLILFGSTPRSLSAFSRSAMKPSGPQI